MGRSCFVTASCARQCRWAAEPAAITRTSAECRLSIHKACGGTAVSAKLVAARAKPRGELPGIHCRLSKAGGSGIHALHGTRSCCHAAVASRLDADSAGTRPMDGVPGIVGAAGRWPLVADHSLARLPRAAWSRLRACGVGTGVEPVTARVMVWCSTTELTSLDTTFGQNP